MTTRRLFIGGGVAGVAAALLMSRRGRAAAPAEKFEVAHSDAEWRKS